MTTGTQGILREALQLPPDERAELAEGILQSLGAMPDSRIDALWRREAESRIDAYDAGQIPADTAEAVLLRVLPR